MCDNGVIERYLAELDAALRLPRSTRQRIVAEVRDHLHEIVADDRSGGGEAAQARASLRRTRGHR